MSTQSNAISESFQRQDVAAVEIPATRTFYWSVRRELWENRSVYLAPLAVGAVALGAFFIGATLGIWEPALRLDAAQPYETVAGPYNIVAGLLMLTGIIVSVFYCLDALHGERRDRSILFWKSLPVSDLTTVLAKASIPLIFLPLLAFAVTVAVQWLMLMVSSVIVLASGQSVAELWSKLSLFRMWWLLFYHLITAHAIWPAPVYCWLLLVSGWARRTTFLWAALPVVAIAGVEGIAFRTSHFAALVGSRLMGSTPAIAYTQGRMFPTGPMTHITPGAFLSSAGFWLGLVVSAAFLAGAVRLRKYRAPI